jgi:hypothetical protein
MAATDTLQDIVETIITTSFHKGVGPIVFYKKEWPT